MTLYAEGTEVAESKSKTEIDAMLRKWKCESVATGEDRGAGFVVFALNGIHVRFSCPMPGEELAKKHAKKRRGSYYLTDADKAEWIEQERKRRWRALLLTLKAKLVSVENGIEKFEEAFLAHIVIAGGQTVGQQVLPAVAEVYKTGVLPAGGLFLGPGK